MNTLARVNIWGQTAGVIAWNDARQSATFQFENTFLKTGLDVSPLKMPLGQAQNPNALFAFPELNPQTFHGLPGMLADSLPDKFGNALIDAWLARQGRRPETFNPVERLCYTGKRGMGALEYEPVVAPFTDASAPLDIKELVQLVKDVFSEKAQLHTNIHEKPEEGLLDIIRIGTSAGGARAKAIIAYNKETGDVRSGQIDGLPGYEYWIIKFDGATNQQLGDPKGYGRIEYAYHLMAKDCGMLLPECHLLQENGRAHFMTKRFDREGNKKLHMQSLCGMAHFDYNMAGLFSYEQAFQIMRQLGLPYTDAEEMYRRMIFNAIARNQDDHTKNISFLMNEAGQWQLSPAYDVTYAYDPANKWMHAHQMSINGKREGITKADLTEVAKNMNIKKPNEIIEQVTDSVGHWTKFAKEAGIPAEQAKQIKNNLGLR